MEVISTTNTRKKAIGVLEIKEGLEGLTPSRIIMLYRRAPLLRPARGRLETVPAVRPWS